MTLLGDLVDCYAAATTSGGDSRPPVPYTYEAEKYSVGNRLFGASGKESQLKLTTGESTLFSVLQLISGDTAAVKWYGEREQTNPNPDQEPPRVTAEQSLAVKLWQKPNKFMTGKFVRTMMTWHYRAVGEAWAVMDFLGKPGVGTPRAWWPVRPDRMWPVPDPDDYLVGYIYVAPDGTKIPLELNEVMRMTFPHPMDPHRGLGVVQTLGTTLGVSLTSEQWIARFFDNDASPGGIIEIAEGLPEMEYNRLRKRWNEQHRGVNKAHRIAILEYGTFKPRQFNMKDMQFAEIRNLTRDSVLEGFRIHKHKMGISDNVNLANAYAADTTFAKDEKVPNLEEWSELANGQYRDLFGPPGASVRLCYENPVPSDKADDRAERKAKIEDATALAEAGVDWDEACDFVGLPRMTRRIVIEQPPETPSDDVEKDEPEADKPTSETAASGELDETKKGDPAAVAVTAQKLYLAVKGNSLLTPIEGRQILVDAGADIDVDAWEADEPQPGLVLPPEADPAAPETAPVSEADPAPAVEAPIGGGKGDSAGQGPQPAGRITPLIVDLTLDHDVIADAVKDVLPPVRAASPADDVDLTQLSEDWQAALDKLLAKWPGILDDQYSALATQVRDAISTNDLDALLQLVTPDAGAAAVLTAGLVAVAVTGAAAVVREAEAQGVDVARVVPDQGELATQAKIVTGLMRQTLAVSAGAAALRLAGGELGAAAVSAGVREHLDSLTDAQPRQALGGAVTAAQNAGRLATLDAAPTATYFASEVLDTNTCAKCRKVEGKRYDTLAESKEDYPRGGYKDCLGGERCRGTVVAIWDTEGDDG
jgi:phage portal protein BeeE